MQQQGHVYLQLLVWLPHCLIANKVLVVVLLLPELQPLPPGWFLTDS